MVNHLTFGVNTFNKDAYSPNVGQDWKSKICIPNAVDCNVNMGIVSRSPSSRRGEDPRTTGRSSRGFSIKDDLTISQGSHTSSRASPSTASRRTASASRISAAGPASASWKRPFPARRRWPTAAATRSRRSCSAPPTPAGPKPSAICSRSIPTTAFYRAGRLAHQREAGAQLRRALRVHETAGGRRRSVLGLFADQAESGRQQLSWRAGVCG